MKSSSTGLSCHSVVQHLQVIVTWFAHLSKRLLCYRRCSIQRSDCFLENSRYGPINQRSAVPQAESRKEKQGWSLRKVGVGSDY
jgi:hypothetical protein